MLSSNSDDLTQKSMSDTEPLNQIDQTLSGPVKILRRPKPSIIESSQDQSLNGSDIRNKLDLDFNLSIQSKLTENFHEDPIKSAISTTIYNNEDEWPSIADASKYIGSQQPKTHPQKINVMKKPITRNAKTDNRDSTLVSSNEPIVTSSATKTDNNNTTITANSDGNNRISMSMKTYKERADDYAKARLRILGSAFSDDDDKKDGVDYR